MTYDDLVEHIGQLSISEKLRLAEHLMHDVRAQLSDTAMPDEQEDDAPLTLEEIHALLNVGPKTGAEIIASGVVGAWQNLGIDDGATWINEQKRRRLERRIWQQD